MKANKTPRPSFLVFLEFSGKISNGRPEAGKIFGAYPPQLKGKIGASSPPPLSHRLFTRISFAS
jgi:hypothetical protein